MIGLSSRSARVSTQNDFYRTHWIRECLVLPASSRMPTICSARDCWKTVVQAEERVPCDLDADICRMDASGDAERMESCKLCSDRPGSCQRMPVQSSIVSNAYGYVPNLPANICGCVLFGLILVVQVVCGFVTRDWWMVVTWGTTAGLELAGYITRALSHKYLYSLRLYEAQLVCLMFAPAFMAAGIYYQLAKEISIYGKRYSPLRPMMYTAICTTCDVVSILVQAAGGGIAAADVNYNVPGYNLSKGGWIMVAGIGFQVTSLSCFTMLFAYVTHNIFSDPCGTENWNADFKVNRQRPLFRYWLPALSMSILFLLIRSIYRIVEISVGWGGYLMSTERYFLILDGLMVLLSMAPLTIVYPGAAYGDVPIEGLHYREGGVPKKQRGHVEDSGDAENVCIVASDGSSEKS